MYSKNLAIKAAKAKGYTYFKYNGEDYFVDFGNRESIENIAKTLDLTVFKEENGNLALYDSRFYRPDVTHLLYIGVLETPPQPINLKSYYGLFEGCSLSSLSLNHWDMSLVENTSHMLRVCKNLQSCNLNSWNTSSVKDMSFMFSYCANLQFCNISSWDTSSVKDMSFMFNDCENLQSLDLNSWNVSSVEDMSYMFYGCKHLQFLNINSWDISSVHGMSYMFSECYLLPKIYKVSDLSTIIKWCKQNDGKGVEIMDVFQ